MEFKLLFFAYLALCAIAFFEVLLTIRQNSLLKICFLLILSSLFVMNYYSYVGVSTRLQFIVVKCMRIIYVCSTMLTIIHLVTPKIPKWIIGFIAFSVCFLIGLRIYYFNQIAIENLNTISSQIFSVGPEFYSPIPAARYAALVLATVGAGVTFYYYRQFFLKMNREDIYYKHLSRWIISMVLPFFLLIIFGAMGNMEFFQDSVSPFLFSIFSCTIIFSILFRPKFLNTTTYLSGQLTS